MSVQRIWRRKCWKTKGAAFSVLAATSPTLGGWDPLANKILNSFKQPQPNIDIRQATPIEWSHFFAQMTESHCIDCWTFLSWTLNHSLILLESSFFNKWFSLFCCFFPQELTDPTDPLTQTHAASGVCGGPLTMASSKHHSESEENVLDWSSTHWHSFDLIPFYHCPTKGDILNWTHQNNIRTNMTATILCCWISFAVVGDSELLISHPEMSPPLLSVTQSCPQLLNPNNTLTDDCTCRSRIGPPSPP